MRLRPLNVIIFAGLLAGASYVAVIPVLFPRSIEAISNAPVAVVRAPIDGRLLRSPVTSGELIRAGQPIGTIANGSVDEKFLLELRNSRAELTSSIGSLDNQILRLGRQIAQVDDLIVNSRDNLVGRLRSQLREAEFMAKRLEVNSAMLNDDAARQSVLFAKQAVAEAIYKTATRQADMARFDLETQRERIVQMNLRIDAAGRGLISDFDGSLASLRLRKTELEERLNTLLSDRAAKTDELAEVERSARDEASRTARLARADLTSPVAGRVWQVSMNDSEFVQEGDTLLEVVNCAARVLTATVSERTFNRLDIGQSVDFVAESDDVRQKGVIVEAIGPASRVDAIRYAIRPAAAEKKEFRIVVQLIDRRAASGEACAIGRTGKIFFDAAYPQALNQFAGMVRGQFAGLRRAVLGEDAPRTEYTALQKSARSGPAPGDHAAR